MPGKASTQFGVGSGSDIPIGELPDVLGLIGDAAKYAGAKASNDVALVVVTAARNNLRQVTPKKRLQSRAGGTKARRSGGTQSRNRTGTGVNYAYLEADADKARYNPTALIVGRGPVHLLENRIQPHPIPFQVLRVKGRVADVVPMSDRDARANVRYQAKKKKGVGPSVHQTRRYDTYKQKHPGVQRSSGPWARTWREMRPRLPALMRSAFFRSLYGKR